MGDGGIELVEGEDESLYYEGGSDLVIFVRRHPTEKGMWQVLYCRKGVMLGYKDLKEEFNGKVRRKADLLAMAEKEGPVADVQKVVVSDTKRPAVQFEVPNMYNYPGQPKRTPAMVVAGWCGKFEVAHVTLRASFALPQGMGPDMFKWKINYDRTKGEVVGGIASGCFDATGQVQLQLRLKQDRTEAPTRRSVKGGEELVPDFELLVGADLDGDGLLDDNEKLLDSVPIVLVTYGMWREGIKTLLHFSNGWVMGYWLGAAFLQQFRYGYPPGGPGDSNPKKAAMNDNFDIRTNTRLWGHGLDCITDTVGRVPTYTFDLDSYPSKLIAKSGGLKGALTEVLEREKQTYFAYFAGNPGVVAHDFPVSGDGGGNFDEEDLGTSVRGATAKFAEGTVVTVEKKGNHLVVDRAHLTGKVWDVYHWNFSTEQEMDRKIACVQVGYEPACGGVRRQAGRIFEHYIFFTVDRDRLNITLKEKGE